MPGTCQYQCYDHPQIYFHEILWFVDVRYTAHVKVLKMKAKQPTSEDGIGLETKHCDVGGPIGAKSTSHPTRFRLENPTFRNWLLALSEYKY